MTQEPTVIDLDEGNISGSPEDDRYSPRRQLLSGRAELVFDHDTMRDSTISSVGYRKSQHVRNDKPQKVDIDLVSIRAQNRIDLENGRHSICS